MENKQKQLNNIFMNSTKPIIKNHKSTWDFSNESPASFEIS